MEKLTKEVLESVLASVGTTEMPIGAVTMANRQWDSIVKQYPQYKQYKELVMPYLTFTMIVRDRSLLTLGRVGTNLDTFLGNHYTS